MIRIVAGVTEDGLLWELDVRGHAGWNRKGQDVVCAAVSVLLTTFGRLVEGSGRLQWESRAESVGDFSLKLRSVPRDEKDLWRGAGSVVLKGLTDLSLEYPSHVNLVVNEVILEENHGSS